MNSTAVRCLPCKQLIWVLSLAHSMVSKTIKVIPEHNSKKALSIFSEPSKKQIHMFIYVYVNIYTYTHLKVQKYINENIFLFTSNICSVNKNYNNSGYIALSFFIYLDLKIN